jgi:hypothetical protein
MQPVAKVSPHGTAMGRYSMYGQIAVGGTATVYFGRLRGERGFSRTVAIKRLHPQFAADSDFVSMLVDEANLAVRVKHPNVVAPLDVVSLPEGGELLLVMEYIHGEPLSRLLATREQISSFVPLPVATSVVTESLLGLHAAHEAMSDRGVPLNIVHRDVSPANILVGVDGVARVFDFGLAKATMRANVTRQGTIKGKLSYMAPEQLRSSPVDRRTDIFAAGVVLWETLTLRRLFQGEDVGQVAGQILWGNVPPPSSFNPEVPPALDEVVARALARSPEDRFATAREFAQALERACPAAPAAQVGRWVVATGGSRLLERAEELARVEGDLPGDGEAEGWGVQSPPRPRRRTPPRGTPTTMPVAPRLTRKTPVVVPLGIERREPSLVLTPPGALFGGTGVNLLPRREDRSSVRLAAGVALLMVLGALAPLVGRRLTTSPTPSLRIPPVDVAPGQPVRVVPVVAPATPKTATPAPQAAPPTPVLKAATPPPAAVVPPPAQARPPSSAAVEAAPSWPVIPDDKADERPRPHARKRGRRPAITMCQPPYYLDGRGIRRVKPECLGRR